MPRKKPRIQLPEINFGNIKSFEDYQTISEDISVKRVVFNSLIRAVKTGLKDKSMEAGLFRIKNTNASISLKRTHWKASLCKAMDFFTEHELYEKSKECKELIDKI